MSLNITLISVEGLEECYHFGFIDGVGVVFVDFFEQDLESLVVEGVTLSKNGFDELSALGSRQDLVSIFIIFVPQVINHQYYSLILEFFFILNISILGLVFLAVVIADQIDTKKTPSNVSIPVLHNVLSFIIDLFGIWVREVCEDKNCNNQIVYSLYEVDSWECSSGLLIVSGLPSEKYEYCVGLSNKG